MNTHTPAPWTHGKPNADTFHVLAEDKFICMLPTNEEESAANARLIAAAPELLAATKRMINWLEGLSDEIDIIDMALQARAAITKAEGN